MSQGNFPGISSLYWFRCRAYRELADQSTGYDDLIRNFEFLREQVIDVMKNQDYVVTALGEVMSKVGIDQKVVEKLQKDTLKKSVVDKPKTEANLEQDDNSRINFVLTSANEEDDVVDGMFCATTRGLIIVVIEIVGQGRKQIPFYESINESPEADGLVKKGH